MSDSQRPHGLQPTRLLHPWDCPGKSTGVGCHCLLHQISLCRKKLPEGGIQAQLDSRVQTMASELCLPLYLLIVFASELALSSGNVFSCCCKDHQQIYINVIRSHDSKGKFTSFPHMTLIDSALVLDHFWSNLCILENVPQLCPCTA